MVSDFAHRASIKTGNFRSFTLPQAGFRPRAEGAQKGDVKNILKYVLTS
jgi:hypothetical protein